MNIPLLFKENKTSINTLLADGNWKQTGYYEVEPQDSNHIGCAHIYSISRQIAAHEEVALVYLLQRLYMEDLALPKEAVPLSADNLLHWLFKGGYISTDGNVQESGPGSCQGLTINPLTGWYKLQKGVQDLLEKEQAKIYKNGKETSSRMLFADHQVKAITAFKDHEKDSAFFDYIYFIETNKAWIFFIWGDVL